MNDNNINPDENEDKMSYEEYMKSDPNYVEPDDLPSAFLSEEDVQPNDINIIVVPKFEPNIPLLIENYVEAFSQCKNKAELRSVASQMIDTGINYGIMLEKKEAMLEVIERFDMEIESMSRGYEEYYAENDDLD